MALDIELVHMYTAQKLVLFSGFFILVIKYFNLLVKVIEDIVFQCDKYLPLLGEKPKTTKSLNLN